MKWQRIKDTPAPRGRLHVRGLWVHSAETSKPLYWDSLAGFMDDETGEFRDHDNNTPWNADDYTHWHDLGAIPAPEATP